ncbi:hypothetical protein BAE40_12995 [Mesorhizobium loti]|nr:hypothetical protein BAE40_12995 [Mesorhizobium loti]
MCFHLIDDCYHCLVIASYAGIRRQALTVPNRADTTRDGLLTYAIYDGSSMIASNQIQECIKGCACARAGIQLTIFLECGLRSYNAWKLLQE